jgi:predicted component of type VI protein secretion system
MLTKSQLASIFRFIADILMEETPSTEPASPSGEAPAPKRRGRPAGSTNAASTEPTATQTTPVETPATETKPAPPIEGAKTLEELKALINPLVTKQRRGAEVKAVINKFKPEGHDGDYTLSALSERPDIHAAFCAEIEALLM